MLPKHNLHVTEDKKSDQSEPPPPRPTSAMSDDFKPPGREAIRKIIFTKLLICIYIYSIAIAYMCVCMGLFWFQKVNNFALFSFILAQSPYSLP